MALIRSLVRPSSASESSLPTRSQAGCLPLIHSRIAQESSTRVFTFALLLLEGGECAHQVAIRGCALELSPGRFFRQHNLLAAHIESQPRALVQVQRVSDGLRNRDLPF